MPKTRVEAFSLVDQAVEVWLRAIPGPSRRLDDKRGAALNSEQTAETSRRRSV
jgi:hypothetical protein